jgi:uncharacterized membrane protein YedE/YeeE
MDNFTPLSATFGGILIGVSATLMLLFSGRITGISGMLGGLLSPAPGEWGWRLLFLIGLIAGASADHFLDPYAYFVPRSGFPLWLLALGGFCVGFGARLGSGCTSGHGICGIARMSRRSIVATLVFMTAGALAVFVVRHVFGVGA